MDELKVTNIEELKKNSTEIIEILPFTGEKPINVRVKRLSILGLCQSGSIPNQLLGAARKLFYNDEIEKIDIKEYGKMLDIICENTLVEPSLKQLKEAGLELTDMQKIQLFSYSQQGVEGLKSFRDITEDNISNIDSSQQQNKIKSNNKHRR